MKGKFGVPLNSGIEVAIVKKVNKGTRRLVLVVHQDLLADLQTISELFFQLLDIDVGRNTNRNQVVLEIDLDLESPAT